MPMLLVAEDSEVDRRMILELLKKEPLDWLVEAVASAEEAVRLMREIAFDVVITDVLMRGMSGLALLNHVHSQPRKVPVIVVSGEDSRAAAIEALRGGASSYIPKSSLTSMLGETVRQVLEASKTEQNYQRLIGTAEEMRFHFKLPNDLALIHPLVSLVQQMCGGMQVLDSEDCTRLGIAIDEALSNAMCHGNLELTEDEMAYVRSHLHDGRPLAVIEERRATAPCDTRFVHVAVLITVDGIKLTVRDDGPGFDVSTLSQAETSRGITLIQNLVDKAAFNAEGNELALIKRASSGSRSRETLLTN